MMRNNCKIIRNTSWNSSLITRAFHKNIHNQNMRPHSPIGCGCMFCASVKSFCLPTSSSNISFQQNSSVSGLYGFKSPQIIQSKHLQIEKRSFTFESNDDSDVSHISTLLENNKKWAENIKTNKPDFLEKLRSPQTPKYLYFGCSDSRVPANEILGLGPGDLFVHRNVGNLVPGNDLNALSVLEYAVGALGVTDIIVTGHYNCGAIKAATSRQDLGMLENWLRLIRDVYRLHRDYLDRIYDEEERHRKLVELNVIEQCINIYKTGIVQRKRISSRNDCDQRKAVPRIHGLVFDTAEGTLKRLNVDYTRVGSLDSIYGLGYK